MKIQCDVCSAEEASIFCCADEAALCIPCDRQVHSANKLAGKHRRFSLLNSSSSSSNLCDICQEKKGILFCQEDRAVLCRDCDVSIHSANSHTMKHNRFLLTGVMLSSVLVESGHCNRKKEEVFTTTSCSNSNSNSSSNSNSNSNSSATTKSTAENIHSSSISEYLINLLPGWHVEDFLSDDASASSDRDDAVADIYGSCLQEDEIFLPFLEKCSGGEPTSSLGVDQGLPLWVPTPQCWLDEEFLCKELRSEVSDVQLRSCRQKRSNAQECTVPEFCDWFGQSSNKRHRNSPFECYLGSGFCK